MKFELKEGYWSSQYNVRRASKEALMKTLTEKNKTIKYVEVYNIIHDEMEEIPRPTVNRPTPNEIHPGSNRVISSLCRTCGRVTIYACKCCKSPKCLICTCIKCEEDLIH